MHMFFFKSITREVWPDRFLKVVYDQGGGRWEPPWYDIVLCMYVCLFVCMYVCIIYVCIYYILYLRINGL